MGPESSCWRKTGPRHALKTGVCGPRRAGFGAPCEREAKERGKNQEEERRKATSASLPDLENRGAMLLALGWFFTHYNGHLGLGFHSN